MKAPPKPLRTILRIDNMDCPVEEGSIRSVLDGFPGVLGLEFDLVKRRLTVSHASGAMASVTARLKAAGFPPEVASSSDAEAQRAIERRAPNLTWWRLALAVLAAFGSEALHYAYAERYEAPVIVLAVASVLAGGLQTFRKGWLALMRGRLNINSLMSVAVTGAMAIGEWPEAAMVMVLFQLAEIIEALSYERARKAIRGLLDLAPVTALVRGEDGAWSEVPAADVPIGAQVRVRPGARIPLDGRVAAGRGAVDQSPITGESLPVDKEAGDPVFAGSINQSGELDVRVTAAAGDSTLARIIHVVEEAQGQRAPTQRFVDAFARVYTPIVFAVAVSVAVVPPLAFGAPVVPWLYKALVLLVIACPCALVISTPVTVVSALAAAAHHGILVKGGIFLEQARKLRTVAFDKTGTITSGKPSVTDFRAFSGACEAEVLMLASSLAARSDHPVSAAVAAYASSRGTAPRDMRGFEALPGRGVKGRSGDSWFWLGNHRLAEDLGVCSAQVEAALAPLEREGKTAVLLARKQAVLALFAVADTVRETSRAALAELHALGLRTIMLTGDNALTARAIGSAVGIDDARGDLLPEDKLAAIEDLARGGGLVGMVGDGVNDAPALARAGIGIAMGAAGSDAAIETANVALMDDDLRKVPALVRLSRRTAQVLGQNIALALGIKGVFLVLAIAGFATMWMAVFADMGASLIVVANGLRLLRPA